MFWSKKKEPEIKIEAKVELGGEVLRLLVKECCFLVEKEIELKKKDLHAFNLEENIFLQKVLDLEEIEKIALYPHELFLKFKAPLAENRLRELAGEFAEILRQYLAQRIVLADIELLKKAEKKDPIEDSIKDLTHDLFMKVEALIEAKINPSVKGHGGRINLLKVKDSRAFIRMEGGCQGCAMSSQTLKQGVEKTICDEIPEILEVVDMTNHQDGDNPYYT